MKSSSIIDDDKVRARENERHRCAKSSHNKLGSRGYLSIIKVNERASEGEREEEEEKEKVHCLFFSTSHRSTVLLFRHYCCSLLIIVSRLIYLGEVSNAMPRNQRTTARKPRDKPTYKIIVLGSGGVGKVSWAEFSQRIEVSGCRAAISRSSGTDLFLRDVRSVDDVTVQLALSINKSSMETIKQILDLASSLSLSFCSSQRLLFSSSNRSSSRIMIQPLKIPMWNNVWSIIRSHIWRFSTRPVKKNSNRCENNTFESEKVSFWSSPWPIVVRWMNAWNSIEISFESKILLMFQSYSWGTNLTYRPQV